MSTGEGGQVSIFVVGLFLVCAAVTGLAIDGTRAFIERRTLQNLADAAARAASMSVDTERYYRSAGRRIVIDDEAAGSAIRDVFSRRDMFPEAEVRIGPSAVHVVLRSDVETRFLSLIGVRHIAVGASATARPMEGEP